MVTVSNIEVIPYNLPLKAPLRWGSGHVMPQLEHILVRITLSDGAVGIAEANPRPTIYGETPTSVTAIIEQYIAPLITGQTLESVADIAAAIGRYALLKNNNSARAAVDMALWSALAQSQNMSLLALLGAVHDRVQVSYILGIGDTDTVLREVAQVYEAGVRVLKVKTGKDFERETHLVRQIKTTHHDMQCYIDANETYTANTATDVLAAFADLGVLYCEEPLPVHHLQSRASLRTQSPLLLIADDSCFIQRDLQRELTFDTFDILNIKPPRNGFTEGVAMLKQAQAAGKGAMMGSQASSVIGCIHTLMMAALPGVDHPSEGTFWLKVDDVASLPIHDGYVMTADLESQLEAQLAPWR